MITGGCLCGDVRYEVKAEQGGGHCHCIDCRKSSGTGHCSHMIVEGKDFSVTGEVRFFEKAADSGNMVRRGFCPRCGSPVYSTNAAYGERIFVRASSLDDPDVFQPRMIVYTDRAAKWDHMDPSLPGFATMPKREDVPA